MTQQDILALRLANQQLSQQTFTTPHDLVQWFGAVQSQDYAAAKWALGQRLSRFTDAMMDTAFDNGEILRTHALRPTWHFVTPEDILWIINLNATRVKPILRYYYRQLDLTDSVLEKAQDIITEALRGGNALTRTELGELLLQAKLPSKGQVLGHIMGEVELNGVVCSGPRRGKQFTYMLLQERAPKAKILSKDESIVELTKRYFQSHGPATVKDFVWWSGLTTADSRKGIETNALESVTVDGLTYYYFKHNLNSTMHKKAYLLPNYDEYTVAFKDRDIFYDKGNAAFFDKPGNAIFNNAIVHQGRLIGMYRRTLSKKRVEIEANFFQKPTTEEYNAFTDEANKYATFLGLELSFKK